MIYGNIKKKLFKATRCVFAVKTIPRLLKLHARRRQIRHAESDEFKFKKGRLKNSVIEIGKAASNRLLFNHLN